MGRNNSAKHGSKPKTKPNRHQRRHEEAKNRPKAGTAGISEDS